MLIVEPSYVIEHLPSEEDIRLIEKIGRVCYKSEDKITENSWEKFLKTIIDRGHESVLEHSQITVRFICDRGVSHELVRHRLASFSQESTRYVNYGDKDIEFIFPSFLQAGEVYDTLPMYRKEEVYTKSQIFWQACKMAEDQYKNLLLRGVSPQIARGVLPNALKTEIVMTANIREWRHILKLRTSKASHPQMRELMIPLLEELQKRIPIIFDDIKA